MTYAEKFRDPRWQKKRLEILARDEFTCCKCGDGDSELQVHHKWYVWNRDPWDYDNKALITLCATCHEEETEASTQCKELLKVYADRGWWATDTEALLNVMDVWYHQIIGPPEDLVDFMEWMVTKLDEQGCLRSESMFSSYLLWLRRQI